MTQVWHKWTRPNPIDFKYITEMQSSLFVFLESLPTAWKFSSGFPATLENLFLTREFDLYTTQTRTFLPIENLS